MQHILEREKIKIIVWGYVYRHVVQSQQTSFRAFYSIFRVIFRVSAGFVCLLGSVFGLWSVLELFVTANIDVKTFWFKSKCKGYRR